MAEPEPRLAGWLMKKAVRTRLKVNWKKRWIVVHRAERCITYSKSEAGSAILTLHLHDKSVASDTDEHGKPYELKVTTKEYDFFVHCATASERDRWRNFVQDVIGVKPKPLAALPLPPPPPAPTAGAGAATSGAPSGGSSGAAAAPTASAPAAASGPPKITSLASLVKSTGERVAHAVCVGANDVGQLGNSQQNPSGAAAMETISALKLKTAPIFVSAGLRFAAAISTSDQLFTWGGGAAGQLAGDVSMVKSLRPYLVAPFRTRRVLAVACGGSHVLAVVAAPSTSGVMTLGPLPAGGAVHHGAMGGTLYSWGSSNVGALGLGADTLTTFTPREVPLPGAAEGALVTYISAGLVTSAAVVGGRDLFVWGDAGYGRLGLGDGFREKRSLPLHDPHPLALTLPGGGEALLPGQVGLGGSFTAYLGRSAAAPPGSPSVLLISGMLGVDVAVVEDAPGTMERGSDPLVSGMVSVSVRRPKLKQDDASKHTDVIATPQPTDTFGTRPAVLTVSAGPTHYAVVMRELPAPNRKSAAMTAAVLAAAMSKQGAAAGAGAGGLAAAAPAAPRGAVYTAGYGLLGHAPPAGARVRTHYYLSVEPVPVGGALAEEGESKSSRSAGSLRIPGVAMLCCGVSSCDAVGAERHSTCSCPWLLVCV